ncbi:MAG: hypothetical protein ABEK04_02120 [Candidatus Nanohalobium sp.]
MSADNYLFLANVLYCMGEDECVVCGHELESEGIEIKEGPAHEYCVGRIA